MEFYSLTPIWPALLRMARCLFTPRHPCPLTFLWTAVPRLYTGKALCHTALTDVTCKSSWLASKTWIPSGAPGIPDSGSPVCELGAQSHRGSRTLRLKCVFSSLCTTELLLLYSFQQKETSKYFGHMRFAMYVKQRESCIIQKFYWAFTDTWWCSSRGGWFAGEVEGVPGLG